MIPSCPRALAGVVRIRPGSARAIPFERGCGRDGSARRWVSRTWLAKKAQAAEEWKARAEEIKQGTRKNMYDILEERGFIHQTIGTPKHIKELLRTRRIGVYAGVDPTAESLHIGHLLPFMVIFFMWMHGFQAVTLLGGSTARVGDPAGRLESRQILPNADLSKNIAKIHYQLKRLWANVEVMARRHGYEPHWGGTHRLVNNNTWLLGLSVYEMMKRVGRHLRLGAMLSKETVKNKLEKGDGMSVGEFMYPIFQGWDFWHLYSKLGIQLQVGGSDQFGNIVQGVDIVKIIRETEEAPHLRLPSTWSDNPYGFTVPLLTDSAGDKIGKSTGNALWLDSYMTTSFDLYGYFMRRADEDVEKLLKLFTFLPLDTIAKTMEEHAKDPAKRVAHHVLAYEVISLVHGEDVAIRERNQHHLRFGHVDVAVPGLQERNLPANERDEEGNAIIPQIVTPNNAPRIDVKLPVHVLRGDNASVVKIFHAAGLTTSRAEAQRLIKAGGLYVAGAPGNQKRGLIPGNLDWTPAKLWYRDDVERYVLDDQMMILRRGKHNVRIVEFVPEDDYAATGETYPGQPYHGAIRRTIDKYKADALARGVNITTAQIRDKLKRLSRARRSLGMTPQDSESAYQTTKAELTDAELSADELEDMIDALDETVDGERQQERGNERAELPWK